MKKVTDPALLSQLEGEGEAQPSAARKPVSNPSVLAALEGDETARSPYWDMIAEGTQITRPGENVFPPLRGELTDPGLAAIAEGKAREERLRQGAEVLAAGGPTMRATTSDDLSRTVGEFTEDQLALIRSGGKEALALLAELPTRATNLLFDITPGGVIAQKLGADLDFSQPEIAQRLAAQARADAAGEDTSLLQNLYETEMGQIAQSDAGFWSQLGQQIKYGVMKPGATAGEVSRMLGQMAGGGVVPGANVPVQLIAQGLQAAGMNANQVRQELTAFGASEDEILKAEEVVFGPSVAVNALLPGVIPGGTAIERAVAGQIGRGTASKAARVAVPAAGEGITEGGAEGFDKVLANIATGKPVLEGVGAATGAGLTVGTPMGTAAGAIDAAAATANERADTSNADALIQALQGLGIAADPADLAKAMRATETPPPSPTATAAPETGEGSAAVTEEAPAPAPAPRTRRTPAEIGAVIDARLAELEEAKAGKADPDTLKALDAERAELEALLNDQRKFQQSGYRATPGGSATRLSDEELTKANQRIEEIGKQQERHRAALKAERQADRLRAKLDRIDNDADLERLAENIRPFQPAPQTPAAGIAAQQEQGRGPTEAEEGTRQEGLEEGQGGSEGAGRVPGEAPAVEQGQVAPAAPAPQPAPQPAQGLAPRAPAPVEVPPGETQDSLRQKIAAAASPGERARLTAQLGALQAREGTTPAPTASRSSSIKNRVQRSLGTAFRGVNVLATANEAPPRIAQQLSLPENADVEGLYDPETGEVFIFEDRLDTTHGMTAEDRAVWVAAHERMGHAGLRGLAATEAGSNAAGIAMMVKVLERAKKNPSVARIVKSMEGGQRVEEGDILVEEALSELSAALQTGNFGEIKQRYGVTFSDADKMTLRRYIDNLVRAIKKALGLEASVPDEEIITLIRDAGRYARQNDARPTSARTGQRSAPVAQRAFQGSPTKGIERMSLEKIGTGEGNASFGWGLYFASKREIAEHYRKGLSSVARKKGGNTADRILQQFGGNRMRAIEELKRQRADLARGPNSGNEEMRQQLQAAEMFIRADNNRGQTYQVEVPEDSELLNWDLPLSQQPDGVRAALAKVAGGDLFRDSMQPFEDTNGAGLYSALEMDLGSKRAASEALNAAGIPGLRYRDGSSRTTEGSGYNYVIWREEAIGKPEPLIASRRKARVDAERGNEAMTDPEEATPFSRRATVNPYGSDQGEDLAGLPARVRVGDRVVEFHGYAPAQEIARKYAARHGNTLPTTYAQVDEDRARRIAQAYDKAEHKPQDPEVKRAYAAMIEETLDQYRDILKTGLKIEFITGEDPYAASPRMAILDVVENNHLWVFPTTDGFGSSELDVSDNPLLAETEFEISGRKALANDIFRVVHDYFGHIANGVGFRADGEENAWREHSAMYSPLARRAMTSETRGQNSWVNYGPNGEKNRTASSADTVYADQKTTLLPKWVSEDGAGEIVASRRAVTDTPEFRRWFGGSKVVDADGNPLVVYHGSHKPLDRVMTARERMDKFDAATKGLPQSIVASERRSVEGSAGAMWFTNDEGVAEGYAGQREGDETVTSVYLSMQNPLNLDEMSTEEVAEVLTSARGLPVEVSTEYGRSKGIAHAIVRDAGSLIQYAKANGYDGLIYPDTDVRGRGIHTSYVTFSPGQIKSATGNSGAFDPENPSIIASRGWSAKKRQPDAVEVVGVHYSNTPGLKQLDPKKAGTAGAGRERRRFGAADFGRRGGTAARLGFYVMDGTDLPPPEDVVRDAGGKYPYRVTLSNLYDLDADPRDLRSMNVDATEEAISDEGFDGFVTDMQGEGGIGRVAVVFDIGNKKIPVEPVDGGIVASRRQAAPVFYSAALRAVEEGRGAPKRANAEAWKGWLDGAVRRGDMKKSERDWLGLDVWLESRDSTTKQELSDFIRANEVAVNDVVLGWHRELSSDVKVDGTPLHASRVLPGGENYRELLLTIPVAKLPDDGKKRYPQQEIQLAMDELALAETDEAAEEVAARIRMMRRANIEAGPTPEMRANRMAFSSGHFLQKNILAHVRFNERTDADGKRILFIEEIQSDWHQAGRKKGYQGKRPDQARIEEADRSFQESAARGEDAGVWRQNNPEHAAVLLADFGRDSAVPDAPLKATDEWAMLAFKRMARWAVDNGFDRIAWTTGAQQNERYNLAKQVDAISVKMRPGGARAVVITPKGGGGLSFRVDSNGVVQADVSSGQFDGKQLDEVVGKDMADKIMAATDEHTFTGVELAIGGEGMRGFYDKILPSAVNKWAKKFGGKVGKTKLDTPTSKTPSVAAMRDKLGEDYGRSTQHSLDITPAMRDAVAEGQPVFSRRTPQQARAQRATLLGRLAAMGYPQGSPTQQPGGAFLPLKQAATELRRRLQDKMLPVLRAQERAGGVNAPGVSSITLPDAMNAYRMENLMYGRTKDRIEKADADYVLRVQRMMKNLGVSPDQLQDFLLARHAPERNARIASINQAMPDGGSGLLTQEATDILAGTAPGPYSGKPLSADIVAKATQIAAVLDKMRDETIANMVDAGLIDTNLANTLKARYPNYVPLRGRAGEPDEAGGGTGRGLNVPRGMVQRALGRRVGSLGQNILGEMVGDLQRSILASEKSKVARAMLRFALANPAPDLYTVEPVDLEWKFSEATGEAYLGIRNSAEDIDTTLIVRDDTGQPVRLRFEDDGLAKALVNMDAPDLGIVLKAMGAINRWRSAVLTRFNPGFAPVNLTRDAIFGFTAISAEQGTKIAAQAFGTYPMAMRAMWRDARNKRGDSSVPDAGKSWDDWARDFAEQGGKTGLTQVDDVLDLQAKMVAGASSLMRLAAEGKPWSLAKESVKRSLGPVIDVIEDINDATENAIRLAVYRALVLDGKPRARAAEYAKNVTINFNRKGEAGPALNAIYLFFNAAMQGTHAVLRVMKNPKVSALLGSLAVLQGFLAMTMMDDDDDDGITSWDMVPGYVKRTSLVIPLGMFTGNNQDYFALPMPYGFNLFPYAGGRTAQWMASGKRATDTSMASDLFTATADAFSPVPVTEGNRSMFGDTLGFLMSLNANVDDFGNPIVNDAFAPEGTPRALMGKADTPQAYHLAARALARAGGGQLDKRIAPIGPLDVAPEEIEAVVGFATGGVGSIINRTGRLGEQAAAGNLEDAMEFVTATPIAGRFVARGREDRAIAERYYGESGVLRRNLEVLKERVRSGGVETFDETMQEITADEPMMRGVEMERYKRTSRFGQRGQPKLTETGAPRLKAAPGSAMEQFRSAERDVEDYTRLVRTIRAGEMTNAQIVAAINDNIEGTVTAEEQLGLPERYNAEAVAPARVRNRAIKLIQDARARAQQRFLQAAERQRRE